MNWYWTLWLFALLPITFGVAEAYAYTHDKPTLSQYIWNLSNAFRPIIFVAGFLSGFLACHFWWGGYVCFIGCVATPVTP